MVQVSSYEHCFEVAQLVHYVIQAFMAVLVAWLAKREAARTSEEKRRRRERSFEE